MSHAYTHYVATVEKRHNALTAAFGCFLPVENDIVYVGKWHIPEVAKQKPESPLFV
tara:strand:- start:328 stop:495 length:168 start_codon:yes stop_codon:yes gene_type:complete